MKRTLGNVLMLLGLLLVLAALGLLLYNQHEDEQAGEQSAQVMESIHQALDPEPAEPLPEAEEPEATAEPLTAQQLKDKGYLGFVSLPSLGIELPVFEDWSDARLKIAPCRQFGSLEDENLVIAGHNYKRHFGPIDRLSVGDETRFTDLDGNERSYTVQTVQTIGAHDSDIVQDEQWNLVLYTCDYSGQNRIMVGCVLKDEFAE